MDIALWIAAVVLAVAFAAAGALKITQPRPKLAASGMGFADDFGDAHVKAIGALEVLGAVGLLLPAVLGTATALVPLAAAGLAALMAGAVVVHLRRGEHRSVVAPVALGVLAAFVAVLRFGPYAF